MFEAAITEFPFVAEMPKREKSKLQKVWDRFKEIQALQDVHGMLIPHVMAAKLLDVSHQRVSQLVEAGKLVCVKIEGSSLITEKSLVELAKSERKAGRPFNTPGTYGEAVKFAVGVGVDYYRGAKKRPK